MTEVPFAKPNKITIAIDRTEELKAKDAEIARLNQELGEERERQKAIRVNEPAPPPKGDPSETAPIYSEDEHSFTLRNVDYANSEFLDLLKFSNVQEAIRTTEDLAKKGSPDAKRAMQELTRKVLHGKPISLEFQGSVKDLATKREKPIPEFCDDSMRKQIESWNAKVRANRLNWKEAD